MKARKGKILLSCYKCWKELLKVTTKQGLSFFPHMETVVNGSMGKAIREEDGPLEKLDGICNTEGWLNGDLIAIYNLFGTASSGVWHRDNDLHKTKGMRQCLTIVKKKDNAYQSKKLLNTKIKKMKMSHWSLIQW